VSPERRRATPGAIALPLLAAAVLTGCGVTVQDSPQPLVTSPVVPAPTPTLTKRPDPVTSSDAPPTPTTSSGAPPGRAAYRAPRSS
jgi:hypothetical protein